MLEETPSLYTFCGGEIYVRNHTYFGARADRQIAPKRNNIFLIQQRNAMNLPPQKPSQKFKSPLLCRICGKPLSVETSKTDGKAVHQDCYVKVTLEQAGTDRYNRRGPQRRRSVSQAIVSFLDSSTGSHDLKHCPVCGSDLEYRNCTFFYNGRSSTMRLPVCFHCVPPQEVGTNNSPQLTGRFRCAICAKKCDLEECTIDERGRAVHYQCLANRFLRKEHEANPRPN